MNHGNRAARNAQPVLRQAPTSAMVTVDEEPWAQCSMWAM